MSNEISRDEKIERYIDGQMSASERQQFERETGSDEQLRRSLRIEQAIATGIAIDRSTPPPRQAEMRARALDAIARIAPATPPPIPAAAPANSDNRSKRRSTGLWITGGVITLALGIGGGLMLQPDVDETRQPVVQPTAPASTAAPALKAPAVTPSTVGTTDLEATSTRRESPAEVGDQLKDDGVKSRSGRTTPAETRVSTRAGSERKAETTVAPAPAKKKPTVYTDPKVNMTIEEESPPK